MTREEAIRQIENRWSIMDYGESEELGEALDMAIEALAQPIICKDYCIDDDHIYCSPKVAERVVEALKGRPTGEWIAEEEYGDLWVCDQCGFASEYNYSFCPICGSMMIGGDTE